MTWVLAILVGVLSALVSGLLFAVVQRRRARKGRDVFRCRVRSETGVIERIPSRWSRPTYGYWAHDVLLVRRGPARVRVSALPVRSLHGELEAVRSLKRLGPDPVSASLVLDDGAVVVVAASGTDCVALVGPFLAAATGPAVRRSP